jgi:hypothetical protein
MTNMIITMNQTQSTCPEVGGSSGKHLGPYTHLSTPTVVNCVWDQATWNLFLLILLFPDS